MNISIEKKKFSDAVHTVSRFAERKKGTLAALSSILVVAGDDGIKMRATNLETGIDLKVEGKVVTTGVVAIPATIIEQFASSLGGEGTVLIDHTGDTALLTSGMGKSSIKTVPYDDFPSIPFPDKPKNRLVIAGALIKNIFSTLSSCASSSMIRPELASIYLALEGGVLTLAATDSFRLAEKRVPVVNKGTQGKFLIPAKNAHDIAQALPDDEVIISFDEHQCAFVADDRMIVTRLTSAVYPDYHQIIPKESASQATILRKDFEAALKRSTIFSDTYQKVKLSFDPKKNKLTLFAHNTDVGETTEPIPAQVDGSALDLSFNHRYLSAVLGLTAAESLSLSAAGIGRPLTIKGVGDASLLYLVSPMNQ